MVNVGLVGCGTIGTQLALAIEGRFSRVARITALNDIDTKRACALQHRLSRHPRIVSLAELIRTSQLVIETASVEAVPKVINYALRFGCDVFIMSVGGLIKDTSWQAKARRVGIRVYIPSGALSGLDGVKAMAVGRISRASLTTSKPPRALSITGLKKARVIFEGSPKEVVRAFPQNTNVAAALMLSAGRFAAKAKVRVVADPSLKRNMHEIEVIGDCGRISCQVESIPSSNPKTSELAIRSAIATLARIFDPISVGT